MKSCLFDMSDCVLYTAFKCMKGNCFSVLRHFDCFLSSLHCSFFSEGRDFANLNAKFFFKSFNINLVAVLFNNVHHVDCNDNRNTKLCKLCCKIKVSFKVCTVDDVKDSIGTFTDKIISCYNLFKCVR